MKVICQVGKFTTKCSWEFALGAYRASLIASTVRLQSFSCVHYITGAPISMLPADHPLIMSQKVGTIGSGEKDIFALSEHSVRLSEEQVDRIIDIGTAHTALISPCPGYCRHSTILCYNDTLLYYFWLPSIPHPSPKDGDFIYSTAKDCIHSFTKGVRWVAELDNAWVRRYTALPLQCWPNATPSQHLECMYKRDPLDDTDDDDDDEYDDNDNNEDDDSDEKLKTMSAHNHWTRHAAMDGMHLPMKILRTPKSTTISIVGTGYSLPVSVWRRIGEFLLQWYARSRRTDRHLHLMRLAHPSLNLLEDCEFWADATLGAATSYNAAQDMDEGIGVCHRDRVYAETDIIYTEANDDDGNSQPAFSLDVMDFRSSGVPSRCLSPCWTLQLFNFMLTNDDVSRWNRLVHGIRAINEVRVCEPTDVSLFQFFLFCLERGKIAFAHRVRDDISRMLQRPPLSLNHVTTTTAKRFAKHFLINMSHDCLECCKFFAENMLQKFLPTSLYLPSLVTPRRVQKRPITFGYFYPQTQHPIV